MLILKCCVRTIYIVMLILQLEKYCLYEREREKEKEKEKKIERKMGRTGKKKIASVS